MQQRSCIDHSHSRLIGGNWGTWSHIAMGRLRDVVFHWSVMRLSKLEKEALVKEREGKE